MVIVSLSVVITGIVFFLKNAGIISIAAWSAIWPSLLIIVGVYLLMKAWRFHSFINKIRKLADRVEEKILGSSDNEN